MALHANWRRAATDCRHGARLCRDPALRLAAYAERFAEAGFAVMVFDYRGWGDSAGEPRRVLDIGDQQDDWRAVLACARTLDGVNTSRVVAWGSSFGAGHVLRIASEDHRLAAVVAQVPHISGPASAFARSPLLVGRLVLAGLRDQMGAAFGRQPYRLPAVGGAWHLGDDEYPRRIAYVRRPCRRAL